ncbi:TonB-dependent receptor [Novosphingobium kaempferiae]|uniref:TonB-dependent receptor n=1 Tax=Novosphingobium kaempferiae TaxID=2896849 RepID=UPI001E2EC432|nr:TonB-dependent receptor [Novosphingobium kaempferiae]
MARRTPAYRIVAKTLVSVSVSCLAIASAQAQESDEAVAEAQAQEAPAVPAEGGDIVVTGFRESIRSALSVKRQSVSAVDAIVAQDIANFPDQNLAESLQRIPGVAIARSNGEGNTITVRGLGPDFTRVRLNGMETVATTPDNTGRGFNFNVFASDLFNSIVVHKTAEAQFDEGSLGAVVDLNTGNPLAGKAGLTVAGSAKVQYNDLNDNVGPRLSGLIRWRDPDGRWAASVSAAYAKYTTTRAGLHTVGWQQGRFNSVEGTPCFTTQGSGGTYVPSASCDAAALSYHPRIPRYGAIKLGVERLGVTSSLQFAPTDRTKISIDGLYAKYNQDYSEQWGQVLLRSEERRIDLLDYTIDPATNTMTSATLGNVQQRVEHRQDKSSTEFYQIGGKLEQEFGDSFKATLFGGMSRSVGKAPHQTTVIIDRKTRGNYSYDFTDMKAPSLVIDNHSTDPNDYVVTEIRDDEQYTKNTFRTVKLDTEWTLNDELKLLVGGALRRFGFSGTQGGRSSTYCAAYGCAPGQTGYQLTDDLAYVWDLPKSGQSGNTSSFVMPQVGDIVDKLNFYARPIVPNANADRGVIEKTSTAYFQFNVESELFGLRYAANAGMRYVRTQQNSRGITAGQEVFVSRSYDDWLPAFNVALFPTESLILRGAISKVMKRPSLGDLTPGGSLDDFDYRVNFGNPNLDPTRATTFDISAEWYFAPGALVSVGLFAKKVDSFPIGQTRIGTYASTGLPTSLIRPNSPAGADLEGRPWSISQPINGPGGTLKGVEAGLQLPFTFLPGFLSNTGFVGNVTYLDSNFTYSAFGPATNANAASFPALTPTEVDTAFLGSSKWSSNVTLYYEDEKFALRGSLAYRGGYNEGTGVYGNILSGRNSTLNFDASMRYQLTPAVALTLEGINLTDEADDAYVDATTGLPERYQTTGRILMAGVRVGF